MNSYKDDYLKNRVLDFKDNGLTKDSRLPFRGYR